MPRLTSKAMAEILHRPNTRTAKLRQQKYPGDEPQSHRIPYYGKVISGIRAYYKNGNSNSELVLAESKIQSINLASRRDNNLRALNNFRKHPAFSRCFVVRTNSRLVVTVAGMEFSHSPELRVTEAGVQRVIFIHCRGEKLDPALATFTLEIAHWVAEQTGLILPIANYEYFDLAAGVTHAVSMRRASTVASVGKNAAALFKEWNAL